jgi:multiple sugar transport system ATP-binding protein
VLDLIFITHAPGGVAARLPSNLSAKIGDTVGLSFRSERLALFDARSGSAIATASLGVVGHG